MQGNLLRKSEPKNGSLLKKSQYCNLMIQRCRSKTKQLLFLYVKFLLGDDAGIKKALQLYKVIH